MWDGPTLIVMEFRIRGARIPKPIVFSKLRIIAAIIPPCRSVSFEFSYELGTQHV